VRGPRGGGAARAALTRLPHPRPGTLPHAFFALRAALPEAKEAIDEVFARVGDVLA